MPELSKDDRDRILPILAQLRADISLAADGDRERVFQMKRYVAKRLEFDERGTPTQRRKLKAQMLKKQGGRCAICKESLPERGAELDRFKAIEGYTVENTQLVCAACHLAAQAIRDTASSLDRP